MNDKQNLGKLGEEIVAKYLKRNGYKIVEKNYKNKLGEIDLIVKKDNMLSFIEVKTRKNMNYGTPAEAVNYNKRKHIYRTAEYYIIGQNINKKDITFDVVEVYFHNEYNYRIIHIKRAIEDCPLRG